MLDKIFCPRCGTKGVRALKDLYEENKDPKFAPPVYSRKRIALHFLSAALFVAGGLADKNGFGREVSIGLIVIGAILFMFFKDNDFKDRKSKWEHGYFCKKCKKKIFFEEMD